MIKIKVRETRQGGFDTLSPKTNFSLKRLKCSFFSKKWIYEGIPD